MCVCVLVCAEDLTRLGAHRRHIGPKMAEHSEIYRWTDKLDRQTDRQREGQTDRERDRQTDRQTDRARDRHTDKKVRI